MVSSFATTGPELEYHLSGKNALCDYLMKTTVSEGLRCSGGQPTWSRVIWDVTAVAWLLDGNFEDDYLVASPIPEYDHHYSFDPTRHLIRYVYHIHRDDLFEDLFRKLSQ